MIKISTDRVELLALDKYNLELCLCNYSEMEKNFGLNTNNKKLSDRERNIYRIRLKGVETNQKNYMWYTTWIIVLKDENRIIGTIMIKGYPNSEGEVIVGYALEEGYRCKGYMTEALSSIIEWIFLNPKVKCVVADTLKDNISSHKILERIGMVVYKEDDECFWWKVESGKI